MEYVADILIVEDSQVNQNMLSLILERHNYRSRIAESGQAAFDAIRESQPDLILLDIVLPDMDGFEICRTLKEDQAFHEIPVIFISALSETENIVEGFGAGGVDYITKPFKDPEVLARVNAHLEIKRLQKRDHNMIAKLSEEIKRREQAEHEALLLEMESERKDILARFILSAYHEFKTPLSIIKATLYLLTRLIEDQALLEKLAKIEEQSDTLSQLIEAMVMMTVLDGNPDLEFMDVSPNNILRSAVDGLRSMASAKQVEIDYEPFQELVTIKGDQRYLSTALQNVINNAIRYTPEGGHILIRAEQDEQETAITIEDSGIGMSSEQIEHIFDHFYRADDARSTRGFGLGLPITRRIIALHAGRIDVESVPGQGSRFTLIIPHTDQA